jgi:hypothetical protein
MFLCDTVAVVISFRRVVTDVGIAVLRLPFCLNRAFEAVAENRAYVARSRVDRTCRFRERA